MKKFLVSLAVTAMAAPMFAQAAAPSRMAVIDVQKVLATSNAGKASYEKLKKFQEERVAKAQKMDEEIRGLENDVNQKKLSLSEEKLTEMTKQISDKKINMQRFAQDADREVGEARDKELQALEAKIKPVIDQIGKEMGLAAIFNKFESGLVYASDAIDITDMVIKRFNDATTSEAPPKAPAKK
ncbi:MAG TPA: OmpH family outer membrane protein [Thermoanaerobaculia bacterium]|nr:OmpH family outer membrane protein [Thermoanaerobaculia bacterium]